VSTSPENAARLMERDDDIDVRPLLSRVKAHWTRNDPPDTPSDRIVESGKNERLLQEVRGTARICIMAATQLTGVAMQRDARIGGKSYPTRSRA
jgi:hypothetical protein